MSNGYRRGVSYSKYPDFGGIASDFLRNMMMVRQYREGREQQEFQRGIAQQQLGMQRERLDIARQPKQYTFSDTVQQAIIASGQGGKPRNEIDWKPVGMKLDEMRGKGKGKAPTAYDQKREGLGRALASGRITQTQYDASLLGIKKEVTPEERKATQTLNWEQKYVQVNIEKLNREYDSLKNLTTVTFRVGEAGKPSVANEAFKRQLAQVTSTLDFLGRFDTWLSSGQPLDKQAREYLELIGKSTMADIRSGKTMESVTSSFAKAGKRVTPMSQAGLVQVALEIFNKQKQKGNPITMEEARKWAWEFSQGRKK